MPKILQPLFRAGHPDRPDDCRYAISPSFEELIQRAEAAGWSSAEVAESLVFLASQHRNGLGNEEDESGLLKIVKRSYLH